MITDVVLVETIWTLRGKRYLQAKEALIEVLHSLIELHLKTEALFGVL